MSALVVLQTVTLGEYFTAERAGKVLTSFWSQLMAVQVGFESEPFTANRTSERFVPSFWLATS